MASPGEPSPDSPSEANNGNFPAEKSHHDDRDLREVVTEGDHDRPNWWPKGNEELPNLNIPKSGIVETKRKEILNRHDLTEGDWKLLQQDGTTPKSTPDVSSMIAKVHRECLDGSELAQALENGVFPIPPEGFNVVLKNDQTALHTTGSIRTKQAWPAEYKEGEWTTHRLGFSMDEWLRAIIAVTGYYNERVAAAKNGGIYRFEGKRIAKNIEPWKWIAPDLAAAGKPQDAKLLGLEHSAKQQQIGAKKSRGRQSTEQVQQWKIERELLQQKLAEEVEDYDFAKQDQIQYELDLIVEEIFTAESDETAPVEERRPLSQADRAVFMETLEGSIMHGVVVGKCDPIELPDVSVLGTMDDTKAMMFDTHNDALISVPETSEESGTTAQQQVGDEEDVINSEETEALNAKLRAARRKEAHVSSTAIMSGGAHVEYDSLENFLRELHLWRHREGDDDFYLRIPTDRLGDRSNSDGGYCW
ncbi:hypothetical protein INS49_002073 [Diaporthe citri]|uniref:uncharacterized protein n=1 Tax=Diaporthe citri TaxID=83186 RepID=UPI001C7FE7B7|nr:uncharacterized protein INS49_002073 [Diaporthe citri]KAG6367874.1 hypothetical protein INS49_002073 [Diaporthe citri]